MSILLLVGSILLGISSLPCAQDVLADHPKVHKIEGTVVIGAGSAPIAGALVDLYDRADLVRNRSLSTEERTRKQKHVAQTKSDTEGRFRLPGIKPGKYELRFTKPEFRTISVIVTVVSPRAKPTTNTIEVFMVAAI